VTRKITNEDVVAPAKYHGMMKSGAHIGYSDEFAPSQTGSQYSEEAITNGAPSPRIHVKPLDARRV
jgi:hypothetical protein